jgi:hypothetical protein
VKIKNAVVVGMLVLLLGNAQAELFDRGGGLLYDDVLKVTWLQDANYAKTTGYDDDGRMVWAAAKGWAANLVYGGYSDWRLASNTPVGADWDHNWPRPTDWNYNQSIDGSTDIGWNITSTHSELSYMYYVNLGLKGGYSTTNVYQPDSGIFGNGTGGGQKDVGLVDNLQGNVYWSGTPHVYDPDNYGWAFITGGGYQNYYHRNQLLSAWAVRDGDVAAPIPEPETYAMLLAGLGLLGLTARRRREKLNA